LRVVYFGILGDSATIAYISGRGWRSKLWHLSMESIMGYLFQLLFSGNGDYGVKTMSVSSKVVRSYML
ncbi:hypothetical protein M8C21_003484, partial [Ambrosia artemisiifolia]